MTPAATATTKLPATNSIPPPKLPKLERAALDWEGNLLAAEDAAEDKDDAREICDEALEAAEPTEEVNEEAADEIMLEAEASTSEVTLFDVEWSVDEQYQ
ncbi:hypothetical protein ONZ45_g5764 [Pleurotus djamor]|nr:hypothetical protein ONZ45_g5764 [Pleurotus djamor]